jgi:pantoate--beta-alanine ligase
LSKEEHKEALKISASLKTATKLVMQGNFSVSRIKKEMRKTLKPLDVSYVEILNRDFELLEELEIGKSIVLVEAMVGDTRLLDNIWL